MLNCRNGYSGRVKVALCGLKRLNLENETVKILGYYNSHNKKFNKKKFQKSYNQD